MPKLKFILTIGDWSGDGHGRDKEFEIEADVELREVQRLYLEVRESSKVHPENVCEDFEDSNVTAAQLKALGIVAADLGADAEQGPDEDCSVSPEGMARLWVAWMNCNTYASFRLVGKPSLPTLHWYGLRAVLGTEEKDHIGFIGYGTC